ncbi:MAG: DNA repair protein RadC [Crocinitomicaceae bacterium]|jgi:DNA repair protein RadC
MLTTIKTWAEEDRPREKLLFKGRGSVSDAELLAILIGSGTKGISAVELARTILKASDNDLNKLSRKSITYFQQFKGIGEAKAISIYASLELARRKVPRRKVQSSQITSSQQCYDHFYPSFADLDHEQFFAMFLNRANNILGIEQISKGGLSGTVADGKVIFQKALESKSSAIIIAHNHPSGQLKPSEADIKLTHSLSKFGLMIDMQILDHLIITDDNYFSFADEGILI